MLRAIAVAGLVGAACTCTDADTARAPLPIEQGPPLEPWSGPEQRTDPAAALWASAQQAALPSTMRQWLDDTATTVPCPSSPDDTCVALGHGVATVVTDDDRTTLSVTSSRRVAPEGDARLRGHVVARADGAVLKSLFGVDDTAPVRGATLEATLSETSLRVRARWTLTSTGPTERSDAAAPSWNALCEGAALCARTGPWPDLHAWLNDVLPIATPRTPFEAALALWAGMWPHALAHAIDTIRTAVPEAGRGFFDTALTGLGTVEFAGARIDPDGSAIAFVRVPTTWVNFTSSLLAYATAPPTAVTLSNDTAVSWAALSFGGIVLALDEGTDPEMGWLMFAPTPERFVWLQSLPRTRAGESSLAMRVSRLDAVIGHVPKPVQSALQPYAGHTLTLRLDDDTGVLTANLSLEPSAAP